MERFYTLLALLMLFVPNSHADKYISADWIEKTLNDMSVEEKIGQLFMVAAYSNKDAKYENELEKIILKYNIGGIIFFQGDPVQQANMTNRYQKASKYPLMIGMDAEHGIGWRLNSAMTFPLMLTNGAIGNDTLIYRLGATIARHCKELGVHVNFAPDVDLNSNPLNPVIGMRSFGENRDEVSRKAIAYMNGTLSQNVLPVAKHFPGHGDTDTDSHLALPIINHSRAYLDSIDLYPYKKMITAGVPAIMVSHLNVPAFEKNNLPATLSPAIVTQLLRHDMKFEGLCFTDAMNMKGVTQNLEKGEAELRALLAGNDILLFPGDVEAAIEKIKQALKESKITEKELDARCKKILMAKQQYVLPNITPIQTAGLWARLNAPKDFALKQELYREALTLIQNTDSLLPLKRLDTLKIASINFGEKKENNFQTTLSRYARVTHFTTENKPNRENIKELITKLSPYNCIIIYNGKAINQASRDFGYTPELTELIRGLGNKRVIICHPAIPYGLDKYATLPIDAFLISYENHLYAQQYAAQAIFGGVAIQGTLPVGINTRFPTGRSIKTTKTRLGYASPEMCHISSACLTLIDSLCRRAIEIKATPGCQVLVAKDGYIIYNNAFGHNTYDRQQPNHTSNIYDIASITKIAATLPAIMKLVDNQQIQLDMPLSTYLTALQKTNKEKITVREILTHRSGLKATIPFIADAIQRDKMPNKNVFSRIPTPQHRLKLKDKLYFNENYAFKDSTLSHTPRAGYETLTTGLYIFPSYRDTLVKSLFNSELNKKKEYLYSDLGFMLLKYAVEEITKSPFNQYCSETFYNRLGTVNTEFNAAKHPNKTNIIPSCIDRVYRKTEIIGTVHDPAAAVFGGIAGHAGLFSTAEDMAKIMELYLNNGTYGGEYYFSPTTVSTFNQRESSTSTYRRGLGFDKPEPDRTKIGPTGNSASLSSFGHTGFTGTMAWSDPDNHLTYIFLSNRTYPDEFNNKLLDENIRTQIQTIIYDSLNTFFPEQ